MDRSPPRPSKAPHLQQRYSDEAATSKSKPPEPARPRRSWNPGPPRSAELVQEYNEPVFARLQPRLGDPDWVQWHADVTDDRKAALEEARRTGAYPEGPVKFNPNIPLPGLPPPPAEFYGSATMMTKYLQRFGPDYKRAINFVPAQHISYICGRPVMVVVCSHEGAKDFHEYDEYLAWAFRPLEPLYLDGYTAKARHAPKGPKHFCVVNWFQEPFLLPLPFRWFKAHAFRESTVDEPVASNFVPSRAAYALDQRSTEAIKKCSRARAFALLCRSESAARSHRLRLRAGLLPLCQRRDSPKGDAAGSEEGGLACSSQLRRTKGASERSRSRRTYRPGEEVHGAKETMQGR